MFQLPQLYQVIIAGLVSAASIFFEGAWRNPSSVGALSLAFVLREHEYVSHSGFPFLVASAGKEHVVLKHKHWLSPIVISCVLLFPSPSSHQDFARQFFMMNKLALKLYHLPVAPHWLGSYCTCLFLPQQVA